MTLKINPDFVLERCSRCDMRRPAATLNFFHDKKKDVGFLLCNHCKNDLLYVWLVPSRAAGFKLRAKIREKEGNLF